MAFAGTQAAGATPKWRDHFPTPGWHGATLWDHRQDDWEPAIGPASNDVYQLGTRY